MVQICICIYTQSPVAAFDADITIGLQLPDFSENDLTNDLLTALPELTPEWTRPQIGQLTVVT